MLGPAFYKFVKSAVDRRAYAAGQAAVLLTKSADEAGVKQAADEPEIAHALTGKLYMSRSGWVLLTVPNALVRGAFDALHEPGAELPPGHGDKGFNAHISVIRPEEVAAAGGPDVITERGHQFKYTLGPVKAVKPAGWDGISKVWFIEVKSPELEALRKSYGLSPWPKNNQFQFHITMAIKRTRILQNNNVSKFSTGKAAAAKYDPALHQHLTTWADSSNQATMPPEVWAALDKHLGYEGADDLDAFEALLALDKAKAKMQLKTQPAAVTKAAVVKSLLALTKQSNVLQDVLPNNVYSQLPGFHAWDTGLGAAAGAGLGGLYHMIRGRSDKDKKNGTNPLWKRMAFGAALGAGTSNLVGDRARRFMSNIPDMQGYNPVEVQNNVNKYMTPGAIWQGAVLDKPLERPASTGSAVEASTGKTWPDWLMMRRELMRRGMGVHTEADDNWFKEVGSVLGKDNVTRPRVVIHPNRLGPGGEVPAKFDFNSLEGDLPVGTAKGPIWNSSVFSYYPREEGLNGNLFRIQDHWDYALEPDNQRLRNNLLKDWWKGKGGEQYDPSQVSNVLYLDQKGATKNTILRSLLLRDFMDKAVAPNSPIFDQTFYKQDDNVYAMPGQALHQGGPDHTPDILKNIEPYRR